MAQPNTKGTLVSGPLQNVSIAYRPANLVGDRVFPIIDVESDKAKIWKYLKGAWFRDDAALRAPGTRAKRTGFTGTYVDIAAENYALAKEVTDEDRRIAKLQNSAPLQPEIDAIQFCSGKIDLSKEVRVATAMKAWTYSEDVEGGWAHDAGTNTFISDIEYYIDYIEATTGFRPNVLLLSGNTYLNVKQISGVLDRIKYTQKGVISADLIASLFGLEEVIVAGAIKNTAKETAPGTEFTASRIWETNSTKGGAFLFYRPVRPGLKVPASGYQIRVKYDNGQVRETTTWREAAEHQDVYEVAENTDIVMTAADLGKYFYDTVAN